MSLVFPPGVTHLADLPYTLHDALLRALMYLSWEELPKEDRPPRSIWSDGEDLNEWFKGVEERRKERAKGEGSSIEDPVDNEAARSLVVG